MLDQNYDPNENLRCDTVPKASTPSSPPSTSTQSNATTSTINMQTTTPAVSSKFEVKTEDDKEEKHPRSDLTAVVAAPKTTPPLLSYADYSETHRQIEIFPEKNKTNLYETVATAALLQVAKDAESFQHVFNRLFCKGDRENLIFAVHAEAARMEFFRQYEEGWPSSIIKFLSSVVWQDHVRYEAVRFLNAHPQETSSNDNQLDLHLQTMSSLLELHIIVFLPQGVRKDYGMSHGEQITLVQLAENRYGYLTNSHLVERLQTYIVQLAAPPPDSYKYRSNLGERRSIHSSVPFDVKKYEKPKIAPKEHQYPHKFFFFQPEKNADDRSIESKDIPSIPKEIKPLVFGFLPREDLYRTWQVSREWHTLSALALSQLLFPQPRSQPDTSRQLIPRVIRSTPPSNPEPRTHLEKVAEINPTLYQHIAAFRWRCQEELKNNSTAEASDEKNLSQAPMTKKSISLQLEQQRHSVIQWIITGELQELKIFLTQTPKFDCNYIDDCFLSPLAWAMLFDHGAMVALLQTRGAQFLPASLPISPLAYAKINIAALERVASPSPILVETIVAAIKSDLSDKDYNELLFEAINKGIRFNLPLARSINLLLWHTSEEEKPGELVMEEKRFDQQSDSTLYILVLTLQAAVPTEFGYHSIAIVRELFAHPNFPTSHQHIHALLAQCAHFGEVLLTCFFEKYPDFELPLGESELSALFRAGYNGCPTGLLYLLKCYEQKNLSLSEKDLYLINDFAKRGSITSSYSSDRSCYLKCAELMQYLIKQGLFLQHPSLIFSVVTHDRYDILAWLLEDGRHAGLLDQDDGNTLLHFASIRSNWPTVQVLLQFDTINVNAVNKRGQTALHTLPKVNKEAALCIFAALLAKGADPTLKDDNEETPLHQISRLDDFLCKLLPYIDVNTVFINSSPLLHHAIACKLPQTLSMLLQDEKVDVNLAYQGHTPLFSMCILYQNSEDLILVQQLLKRRDLDINKPIENGSTVLAALVNSTTPRPGLLNLLLTHPRMDFAKEKTNLLYRLLIVNKWDRRIMYRPVMLTLLRQTTLSPIPPDEIEKFLSGSQPIIPTLQMLVRFSDHEVLTSVLIHPKTDIKLFQTKENYSRVCAFIAVDYVKNSSYFRGGPPLSKFNENIQCRLLLAEAVQALAEDNFTEFNSCLVKARELEPFQVVEYLQQIIGSQTPTHPFHGSHPFTEQQLAQVLQAESPSVAAIGSIINEIAEDRARRISSDLASSMSRSLFTSRETPSSNSSAGFYNYSFRF